MDCRADALILGRHFALPTALQAPLGLHAAFQTAFQAPLGFHSSFQTGLQAPLGVKFGLPSVLLMHENTSKVW